MLKIQRMLPLATVLAVLASFITPSISTSSSSSQGEQNDNSKTTITTTCSQDTSQEVVQLPPVNNDLVLVNMTLPVHPAGATSSMICKWEIPPPNLTSSTQILLLSSVAVVNFPALACGTGAFVLSEKKVSSSTSSAASLSSFPPHLLSMPPCSDLNPAVYAKAVMTRPGFSLLVTLRINSAATTMTATDLAAASQAVTLFLLQPISWAGVWPSGVFITASSTETAYRRFAPRRTLQISRMPDFFVCRWEFHSPQGEAVHLQVNSYNIAAGFNNSSPPRCNGTGDRLLVHAYDQSNTTTSNNNNGPSSSSFGITIPVCRDPDFIKFDVTSAGGRVSVTFETDGTGGAYEHFYIEYWHEDGCPSSQKYLKASQDQEKFFKGVYFYNDSGSTGGLESTKTCTWVIYNSDDDHVVLLTRLDAGQFQANCNNNQDYLQLGSDLHPAGRLSLCDKNNSSSITTTTTTPYRKILNEFPVWINRKQLVVRFNNKSSSSNNELNLELPVWSAERRLKVKFVQSANRSSSRSFLLHYRAVRKGQCQGHPARRIVGSDPAVVEERLQPIPTGERDVNGPVCLWLFTAKDLGHILQLTLTIPAAADADNHLGNFIVYNINGTTATITTTSITQADKINPDRSITTDRSSSNSNAANKMDDNSTSVTYTSQFRAMLVAYRRGNNPDLQEEEEEGFLMTVRQIRDPATSGGMGLWVVGCSRWWVLAWWWVLGKWFVLK